MLLIFWRQLTISTLIVIFMYMYNFIDYDFDLWTLWNNKFEKSLRIKCIISAIQICFCLPHPIFQFLLCLSLPVYLILVKPFVLLRLLLFGFELSQKLIVVLLQFIILSWHFLKLLFQTFNLDGFEILVFFMWTSEGTHF